MGNWYDDYEVFYDLAEIKNKLLNTNKSNKEIACYAFSLMEEYQKLSDYGEHIWGNSKEECFIGNTLNVLKENLTEETKEEYKCYINELEAILE